MVQRTKIGEVMFGELHLRPWDQLGGFLFRAAIKFGRSFVKIFEESGAEPALHLIIWRPVPIATVLFASPFKFDGVAGKRGGREDEAKALPGVGNFFDQAIDHGVDAGHEGFSAKTYTRVVENPHAF